MSKKIKLKAQISKCNIRYNWISEMAAPPQLGGSLYNCNPRRKKVHVPGISLPSRKAQITQCFLRVDLPHYPSTSSPHSEACSDLHRGPSFLLLPSCTRIPRRSVYKTASFKSVLCSWSPQCPGHEVPSH